MPDLVISVDIDAKGTRKGGAEAKDAIKGIGDEAEKTGRKVKSLAAHDVEDLNRKIAIAKDLGVAFGAALAGLGTILLAATAAVVATAKAIYELSQAFSAYAVEIGKAHKITGLSTETLSALSTQARITGTSFDAVGEALKGFTKTIGDANNGQKEASAKLARLGIDAKKAARDLDGAFRDVLKKILSLPPGVQQANAAMDAFGEAVGYKLLPYFESFKGDIDGLIAKAREMGTVLSEEDILAGEEFARTTAEIQEQLRGLGLTFGRELLPEVVRVLKAIDEGFDGNRSNTQKWAEDSGAFLHRVITILGELPGAYTRVRTAADDATQSLDGLKTFVVNINPALKLHQLEIQALVWVYEKFAAGIDKVIEKGKQEIKAQPDALRHRARAQGSLGVDSYFTPTVPKPPKVPKLTEEQKQAKKFADLLADLQMKMDFFGDSSEEAATKQKLLRIGITDLNGKMAQQAIELAKGIDLKKADAEASKKAADAAQALRDVLAARLTDIEGRGKTDRVELNAEIQALVQQIALGRELTDVERAHIENRREQAQLEIVLNELRAKGADPIALATIAEALVTEQKETLKLIELYQKLKEQRAAQQAFKDLSADIAAEIADLNVQLGINSVLTEENRIKQLLLTDAYRGLTDEQRKAVIEQAKQVDVLREAVKAQEEAQRAYDDLFYTIRDGLDAARGGFKNFFSWVKDRFSQFLTDLIAEWLTSKFFDMFFKGGNQRVAQQNGQGGGGILGSIFNGIFGPGSSSGSGGGGFGGFGGTPGFNPGYFNSLGGGGLDGINVGSGGFDPNTGTYSNASSGVFGGGLSGTIGTIGGIGVVAGGLIGGRAGSLISNVAGGALAGLALGAKIGAIGGPIGAAIGAGVGFLASILGGLFGDPKRKRDKKEKIPALNKGFTDALAQLRQLIVDTRTLRVSPDAALSRAVELRSAIASGFDIQFESKKYRKQAQTMIAAKLREADALITELRSAAEIARAASERDRRILPEFAKGVYLSPAFQAFRRQNGMLAGTWTGRDTIPAMLARGEMVLNPYQQDRVRANAGFDVFKKAGIPGYAAGGMVTGQPSIQPVLVRDDQPITVQVSLQQDATGMFQLSARSPQGRRVLLEVIGDGFRNDEVKTTRR